MKQNKTNLLATWRSRKLESIPNYNSNFTNWIDCILYEGEIILDIQMVEFLRTITTIKVPVIFMGGHKGYVALYTADTSLFDDKIILHFENDNSKEIPFKFVSKDEIMVSIFDEELIFIK